MCCKQGSEVLGYVAGKSSEVELEQLRAEAVEGLQLQVEAVCSGSSTVQASGDDSGSSVELGLLIDR